MLSVDYFLGQVMFKWVIEIEEAFIPENTYYNNIYYLSFINYY